MRKPFLFACLVLGAIHSFAHEVVTRYRTAINFPNIAGYVTLKCDFHIHTVFSDGLVWPTVRSEEAWREGLDAIAITDHIEYLPHKADLQTNHNRAYELANSAGADLKMLVIQGSEITRTMPPGHLNAIYLTNATPLATPKWEDAVNASHAQGAFIFWNHPTWPETTNGLAIWHPEHTRLLNEGKLHGIEVVNGRDYYPEAHRWALEKKLAMLSNSDIHQALNLDFNVHAGDHRPLTLVFAKERTTAAIKEALFARRTAVYSGYQLIGEEQFLRPIFEQSVILDREIAKLPPRKIVSVQISNSSDVSYELQLTSKPTGFSAPKKLVLVAGKTVLLELKADADAKPSAPQSLEYQVTNLLIAPGKALSVTLPLKVTTASPEQ
jgi:predicted metal-dependent phosphoesterase TrpH